MWRCSGSRALGHSQSSTLHSPVGRLASATYNGSYYVPHTLHAATRFATPIIRPTITARTFIVGTEANGTAMFSRNAREFVARRSWSNKMHSGKPRKYTTETAPAPSIPQSPLPPPEAIADVAPIVEEGSLYTVWLNNVYPVKRYYNFYNEIFSRIFRSYYVNKTDYERKIHSIFPARAIINLLEPVNKEGGVYVQFRTSPGQSIESHFAKMTHYLRNLKPSPRMYPFARKPKAFLVKGNPFKGDLVNEMPNLKLYVYFKGPDIPVDELYARFKSYGRIRDIEIPRGQKLEKEDLRQAIVTMFDVQGAIAARNCLHNRLLGSTQLIIKYEIFQPISSIRKQFKEHPRIMIPLVGIAATGATVLLFDPIRIQSIYRRRLTQRYPNKTWRQRTKEKLRNMTFAPEPHASSTVMEYRQDIAKRISNYFAVQPSSVLCITAPAGSGGNAVVQSAVLGRKKVIYIKCDGHRSLDGFIEELCSAVAFAPSFYYLNQIGASMDAFIPTSSKFFSQGPVAQVQGILQCLTVALQKSAAAHEKNPEEQYPVIIFDGMARMLRNMQKPEEMDPILNLLYTWSSDMATKNKCAHVVYLSDDVFAPGFVRRHVEIAGGRIDMITVGDLPPEQAKSFINARISGANIELSEEDYATAESAIGGRVADLDLYCRKLKSGFSSHDAIAQMVSEAINTIRNEAFDVKPEDAKNKPWLKSQLWDAIQKISNKGKVDYDELLYTSFNGDEKSLHALVRANMLRITYKESGKIESVTAFSPLYAFTFRKMLHDPKMAAGIGIVVKKFEIEQETNKMNKVLDEMVKLRSLILKGKLFGDIESVAVRRRRLMLEAKLQEFNAKLEKLENQLAELNRLQSSLKWK